jgi:hypothetical protein
MRKALLVLAFCGFAASLWAADAFVGTWKFSIAKSKYPPSQESFPKEQTVIIREVGTNHESSSNGTRLDGSSIADKWTVPLQGGIIKYQQGGPAAGSYIVMTRIEAGEVYWTLLQNGKQVEVHHYIVSKDGKTFSATIRGTDAEGKLYEGLLVWDRQ